MLLLLHEQSRNLGARGVFMDDRKVENIFADGLIQWSSCDVAIFKFPLTEDLKREK